MAASIHVVSKGDNRQHTTFQLSIPTSPLAPSSVRARTALLSLSSNNLSYARGGTLLHWWDAYPVPTTSPAPYNDQSAWGIVPAWGFATILESTIPALSAGTTLWGFWPTSDHPIDLTLAPGEPSGHWIETSPHRSKLMSIYNRYEVTEGGINENIERAAWTSAFLVWCAGYVLCEYVFPPHPSEVAPIHPLPGVGGPEWTIDDADLSSAVFINLAASTKTARSIAYNFFCRSPGTGPLGLLQVTSAPGVIAKAADTFHPPFPVNTLSYAEAYEAEKWLADLKPSKVVIGDCGARDGVLEELLDLIEKNPTLKSTKVVIIQIGSQQKVYTTDELVASRKAFTSLGKLQFNTSGIRDIAIENRGADAFFRDSDKRFDQWLSQREMSIPDMQLVWGDGVVGSTGLEGGWQRICDGKVGPQEALVYRM